MPMDYPRILHEQCHGKYVETRKPWWKEIWEKVVDLIGRVHRWWNHEMDWARWL